MLPGDGALTVNEVYLACWWREEESGNGVFR